jgi:hypothetical protein
MEVVHPIAFGMEEMPIPERLIAAKDAPDPARAIREAVIELRDAGRTKDEVSAWLNDLLVSVRREQSEPTSEDAILNTLDAVEGWCHPSARLFPEPAA